MRLISFLLFLIGVGAVAFGAWQYFGPGIGEKADLGTAQSSIEGSAGEAPAPVVEAAPELRDMPPPPPTSRTIMPGAPAPGDGELNFGVASAPVAEPASVVDNLKEVPVAYETPKETRMGEKFEVTLAIDATGDSTAADALTGRGEATEAAVRVSNRVSARLMGSGFEITTDSPDPQTISPLETNTWRWQVRAVDKGSQDLTLEIYALIGEEALPVRTYRNSITVEVSTVQQVIQIASTANPVFVILGGLGSLLAGLFGMIRFIRGS